MIILLFLGKDIGFHSTLFILAPWKSALSGLWRLRSEFGNSSALITCNGKTYLIDCGFTIYASLKKHDLFNKIDYVLLTHLHNDHTGSLVNTVLHYNLISHPGKKLKLVYPTKKFKKQINRMMDIALMDSDVFAE
jgi:ribonuclease BN (tRNA processing enzyme)